MKTKCSLLVIISLLFGLLVFSSPAQAAPEPEDIAVGAPLTRQTITAGENYTCAIQTDGTIACWGGNPYGMLDNIPTGTFTQIDAYSVHTCAIRTDGTLACWGYNHAGQATPPDGTFTQVTVGDAFSCGIRTDGTLACWGAFPFDNETGAPLPIPPGTFTQVSAGKDHACAIKTDGTVTCWGRNFEAQSTPPDGTFVQVSAGYFNTCGVRSDGTLTCWGWNDVLNHVPETGTVIQVSAGPSHTCDLRSDGSVFCWRNTYVDYTDTGLGTQTGPFVQITTGGGHSCGLKADGTIYCWGQNESGQVNGTPSTYTGSVFRYHAAGVMPGSFGQRQVSAGTEHSCSIQADGTLACWGQDYSGETIPPSGTFRQISLGTHDSCGLRSDGTLACWGDNTYGKATPPSGIFRQVSMGTSHACGLKVDGTVACWGENTSGKATPPGGTFRQVSAGAGHSCGLKSDGTLACWGNNTDGQASPPAGIFSQVSAGGGHTCALATDGALACWGNKGNGQTTVPSGTFTQVSAGWASTCALRTDGTAACWGNNLAGQSSPPDDQFVQVSVGRWHTCGTRADGLLACWGLNGEGQSLDIMPNSLPLGAVGIPFSQALTAFGGTAPYTFGLVTAGSLPPELGPSAEGLLEGTPSEVGTYAFTVQVLDANFLLAARDYTLTVNLAPQVTTSPADATFDEGSEAAFNAAADGIPTPNLQWEVSTDAGASWNPVEGATSTRLTFTASLERSGSQYRAVFTNVAGSATTNAATLTVTAVPPTVTLTGPSSANEGEVKSYTFTSSDPGGGDYFLGAQSCGANGTLSNASFIGSTGAGSFDCTFPDGPATSTVSVQVKDRAGASNDASTIAVTVANLVPQVGAVTIAPEPSILNGEVVASASFSDAGANDAPFTCAVDYGDGSGSLPGTVDGTTCTGPAHAYTRVGNYTVTLAVTDKDGGTGTASAKHSVLYNFVGFSQPVDNNGVLNIAKAGQGIPLKFRLLDAAGNPVNNLDPTSVKVGVASLACSIGPTTDLINEYTSSTSGLQNLGDGYYQWNWKTPSTYANTCKTLKLDLGEGAGVEHTALFQFKK